MATPQTPVETVDLTNTAETHGPFVALPVGDLIRQVTDVFPDICPVHLGKLAQEKFHVPESIIDVILQDLENGVTYPKRSGLGKRKRQSDPILETLTKSEEEFGESDVKRLNEYFIGPSWKGHIKNIKGYKQKCVDYLVSRVFRKAPKMVVKRIFDQQRDTSLFELYWLMGQHGYREEIAGWEYSHQPIEFDDTGAEAAADGGDPVGLYKELYAARRIAAFKGREVLKDRKEVTNRERAEVDGTLRDCGCCFSDEPMNRMVSCDADPEHLFCYACARKHAETQLGLSKYELKCLSMDDCPGSFLGADRKSYLDSKTIFALDRLEQDVALQGANIENLVSCPFCPYAAECPPAEEDKEFRCQNPECRVVSCRLCSRETHIPKTCAETAADHKDSARRQIEEAMSAAMIRKCNKCKTPFVKLSGCNKMTCSKPGCRNQQCYICGKSCDYNHFTRTGCLLHDTQGNDVETRHHKEAEAAQEAIRKQLLEENPDITEEELRIKLPGDVAAGKKKPAKPRGPRRQNGVHAIPVPQPLPYPQGHSAAIPSGPIQWNLPGQHTVLQQEPQFGIGMAIPQQHWQSFQYTELPIQGRPFQVGQRLQQNQGQPLFAQVVRAPPQQPGHSQAPRSGIEGAEAQLQALEERNAAEATELQVLEEQLDAEEAGLRRRRKALGHAQAPPATASSKAEVLGPNPRCRNANGVAASGCAAPQSPQTQAIQGIRQTQSRYSVEVRLSLVTALHPYIEEISQQVTNHIQAAWVGVMPFRLAESTRYLVEKEIWKGVSRLVEDELEGIDRTVKITHWEKLYSAQAAGPGELQHRGEIPGPETPDDYVALHAIIRSRDRRAPPHHEELARQAHARVMDSMGKRQPPPRVAPFHHYGRPDGRPPPGHLGTVGRIQRYMARRRARDLGREARDKSGEASEGGNRAGAGNKTAGGRNLARPPTLAVVEPVTNGKRSPSQPSTPGWSPQKPTGYGPESSPQLLQRTPRSNSQPRTLASSAGPGSKDTPILIDQDSDDESQIGTPSRAVNGLPYSGVRAPMMAGVAQGGGEPSRKRVRL